MRKFILLIPFSIIHLVAYTQVIKGTIFDIKTKSAIYSASVYFNGTSLGTLSDENGSFQLDISRYHTSMPLTISAIGYYSVTLKDFSTAKPNLVYMKPRLFELNEVKVDARFHSLERKENLTIFRNEFLGTTGNALNCEITNEDDIRFKYSANKDTLKAFTINPLLIENKALGYNMTYYLDRFDYDKVSKTCLYKGNIIFREDSTAKNTKKLYFERRRRQAYYGSKIHFFRALWSDGLISAGFTVRNSAKEVVNYKKIVFQKDSLTKYLKYPGPLGISYYTKQSTSFIVLLKETVFFDSNGYFEPEGIMWEGEIAKQRVADLIPNDYVIR
jgi:hypothetical protein